MFTGWILLCVHKRSMYVSEEGASTKMGKTEDDLDSSFFSSPCYFRA